MNVTSVEDEVKQSITYKQWFMSTYRRSTEDADMTIIIPVTQTQRINET